MGAALKVLRDSEYVTLAEEVEAHNHIDFIMVLTLTEIKMITEKLSFCIILKG